MKMKIIWRAPDVHNEIGDFFENPSILEELRKHKISFPNKQELLKFFHSGKLEYYIPDNIKNLILVDEKVFKSMSNHLKSSKTISMAAPTVIKFPEYDILFTGNKRCNLAMKYDIPIQAWVINCA